MVRQINRLTTRQVDAIKSTGRHADGQNLFLSVSENGGRRWVFLYRWKGGRIELGLGSARHVGLARAREFAREVRELLRQGINPKTAKLQKLTDLTHLPPVHTFGSVANDYIVAMAPGWKNEKHAAQWKMTMDVYAGPLRDIPVADVTTEDVLKVLKPIWTAKPETAGRVRGRIERVLSAAKAKGHRLGENPAQWRGHLDQMLPKLKKLSRGHFAALGYDKIPDFMSGLRKSDSRTAQALEFLILTVTRSNETRGALVGEIDLTKRLWVIPAQRMKAARDHRVPLTPRALSIASAAMANKEPSDLLFAGAKKSAPLAETNFRLMFERMGYADITAHGFRSTFKDRAAECTSFPNELSEMALAHMVSDKTEAAYRRGDMFERRRKLMDAWEKHCLSPAKLQATGI